MSAILEAAMQLKTARDNEAKALEEMQGLEKLPPHQITEERVDAALHASNEAIHARVMAERAYLELTAPDASFPRPFSVVEVEGK